MKIGGMILVLILLAAVGLAIGWTRYVDYHHPEMPTAHEPNGKSNWEHAWNRYKAYACHPKPDWLEACPPDEIRIMWSPAPGYAARLILDTKVRTERGEVTNGITVSEPYRKPWPGGDPVSGDKIETIQTALRQLPPGDSYDTSRRNFGSELHVAWQQDGAVQVRHFPQSQLPPGITETARLLRMHMP